MLAKKLSFGALLTLALAVGARGATISCVVIETGVREEIPTLDSSRLWEYALLDVFFDTGHIVSNAPILRAAEKPRQNLPDEARGPLNEALEGGAEFFIVAVLDYQSQGGTERPQPRSVSLRLFQTAPHRLVYSQEHTARDIRSAERDELNNARNVVRALAIHLSE
jgi:hypothetical protein